ncbi:hypothetical protein [Actinomadura parmotrematis]|uniref:DUF3618 domain-containing protein n=1 Tax=Actinomadura parmotrematis TaxID=2864039 RepID=A0ABS7G4Y0_9ACTN|nr:hypothetical protein [Actinomadura parmotrematis]MBW8487759.1 hypothetical protein [Actinomadura parmotrematis]
MNEDERRKDYAALKREAEELAAKLTDAEIDSATNELGGGLHGTVHRRDRFSVLVVY